jgi:hypothetical protein
MGEGRWFDHVYLSESGVSIRCVCENKPGIVDAKKYRGSVIDDAFISLSMLTLLFFYRFRWDLSLLISFFDSCRERKLSFVESDEDQHSTTVVFLSDFLSYLIIPDAKSLSASG